MTGGKRKRAVETLEELLDRPWCYYCERDFDDQQVLQTHQREVHFHCDHCNRRLNTANGLSVHTLQVHKAPITAIRNSIEGRESPNIEIFGTLGIPEEVMQAHRQSIIDEYYRRQAQHRARTGNPLPGTVKHDPNKKGKREETPAEIKARLDARMAAKRAAREAAARGEHSSQTPEQQTPAESNASPPAALQQMPTEAHVTPGMMNPSTGAFMPTLPTLPVPVPHDVAATAAFMPQQTMMAISPPNMANGYPFGYPPPPQGYPPQGYPPQGYPTPNNYGAGFYSHPMAPMQNTQVPRTSSSPHNMLATHLPPPSAPGLPQRPSFDAPALTKTEMAHLHTKSTQHAPTVSATAPAPTPPPAREPTPPPPPPKHPKIAISKAEAIERKTAAIDLVVDHPIERRAGKVKGEVEALLQNKTGAYMLWFPKAAFGISTFEEIKRDAPEYQFDEIAGPTETIIAE